MNFEMLFNDIMEQLKSINLALIDIQRSIESNIKIHREIFNKLDGDKVNNNAISKTSKKRR